jgi:predicted GIY-YIG superfamily endonuclease
MTPKFYRSPIDCAHQDEERLARDKNGNPILYRQCVLCGKRTADPIKLTPEHRERLASIPVYDRDRAMEARRIGRRSPHLSSSARKPRPVRITRDEQLLTATRRDYISVYVLKLEGQRIYVGQAVDPHDRVTAHFAGKGSAWTQRHRPKKLLEIRQTNTRNWKLAEDIENEIVISLMKAYGWKNVRGGYWSNTSEEETRRGLRAHGYLNELDEIGQQSPSPYSSPATGSESGEA